MQLGDNCIVFENFRASIGDLMVANRVYWRRVILGKSQKNVFGKYSLKIRKETCFL